MTTPTREARIYLAIWRKAYDQREDPTASPIVINCSSPNMAIKHRLGLYRAIRPYREGKLLDYALSKASESFVVTINGLEVSLQPRKTLLDLEASLADFGISEEELLLPEEREAAKSLESLLDGPALPRKTNPFY
jgi:hypothetical protein